MDARVGMALIEGFKKLWQGKIRGFVDVLFNRQSNSLDMDAVAMRDDAVGVMALVSSGEVEAVHYDSCIILMDESLEVLAEQELALQTALSAAAYGVRRETVNAVEAWCGSLVGDGYSNVRRALITTRNLSDLFPISAIWSGEKTNPSPLMPANSPALLQATSVGATSFRLNIHWTDIGHFAVFGPTGGGKSTLLCTLTAQFFRYENAQVFVFDKGYSMWALNQGAGGSFYDIGGPSDSLSFCPLSHLDTQSDRTWAVEYIETLLGLVELDITSTRRNAIAEAIDLMAGSPDKTLTEFTTLVQDYDVRESLRLYTVRGQFGSLLDASLDEDRLADANFTVFEMSHLMLLGDKAVVPVLLYLFRQIERRLKGRPSLIVIDEAWIFLDHPMFQTMLRSWLKEMRKKNCAVGFATQSLSDVYNSKIRDVILEQCMTKFYLPNGEAANELSREFYRQFGCNRREIAIIQKATPKREYFVTSPAGRRLFSLNLGPVALSWVAVSDPEKVEHLRSLKRSNPTRWVQKWIREKCGKDWAEYYGRLEAEFAAEAFQPLLITEEEKEMHHA
jgi:type IV secretion system protein VirB4